MSDICITIDMDWACDDVLKYSIDYLERHNVKATFFVTHNTPLLERLRGNPLFELGVHPNFQYLLNGTSNFKNMSEVLESIMKIVPDAVSVRSHSLVQSSPILDLFIENGLKYDVNLFIPWQSDMTIKPIKHWNGLIRYPYCWEDDVSAITNGWFKSIDEFLRIKGLKIINFHPIHLFLNTERLERYNAAREDVHNIDVLNSLRYMRSDIGAMSTLKMIVDNAFEKKINFRHVKEIRGAEK